MKKLIAIILSLMLLNGCAALVLGGAGAAGGYYWGKHRQASYDAYNKYVADCQAKNIVPMDYNSWIKTR